MDYITLIIGLISGGIIGFLVSKLLFLSAKEENNDNQEILIQNASLSSTNEKLSSDLENVKTELNQLRVNYQNEVRISSEWKTKHESLEEKIQGQKKELDSLQEKFTKEFEMNDLLYNGFSFTKKFEYIVLFIKQRSEYIFKVKK